MNEKYPIHIHRREDAASGAPKFLVTTALVKLTVSPDLVQAQLGDLAEAYTRAIAEAHAALSVAKRDAKERARAYWRVGKALRDFEAALGAAGFYLVRQTETFARDLGMHPGALRKVLTFQKKFSDPNQIDPSARWSQYSERRTRERT